MTRGDLTDDEWTVFEPLLPLGERGPVPDLRRLVNGVMWRVRTGGANRKKKGARGGRPPAHDTELYRDRNTVERCINKIKEWRGLATPYDKTPVSYLAGLHLRGAVIWLRSDGARRRVNQSREECRRVGGAGAPWPASSSDRRVGGRPALVRRCVAAPAVLAATSARAQWGG
jgi:transposase